MNRPGAGPPPLRAIPGNAYQQPQSRTPLGSGRLQNGGKLGSGSGWGFGVPNMAAAPGLVNPQSRPNSAAMTSFARTIGSSQSATPLDLTEFPSLSSAQPQQHQNFSQAAWANATPRTSSQASSSRPLQQGSNNPLGASSQASLQQQQNTSYQGQAQASHLDNPFASQPSTQFANTGLDDFSFGGGQQSALGPLTGSTQPKTGSIDEFPPLGRNANGEIGQPRGGASLQNPGFGGGGQLGGNGYGLGLSQPQSMQGRSGLLGSISGGRQDGNRQLSIGGGRETSSPMGLGSGVISATRSPVDSSHQGQNGVSDHDRINATKSGPNGNNISSAVSNIQQSSSQSASGRSAAEPSQYGTWSSRNAGPMPNSSLLDPADEANQPNDSLASMGELDRFGLEGLLHMIRDSNSDLGALAVGQELNSLGLDLQQPDPLYPTFASPFADANMRSIEPDFSVPACYTVQNIHPLATKVKSFSDETLFYIFYQMPRDIMQEEVAAELNHRNWRYHKELKQWLTKDTSFEPVRISPTEERGYYIFFDQIAWQRQRREFVLQYDSLDARPVQPLAPGLLA